jgi:formate hydrogenlyase subunit 3/multisubunit Na+/H+ antiporter MnhD subunit
MLSAAIKYFCIAIITLIALIIAVIFLYNETSAILKNSI